MLVVVGYLSDLRDRNSEKDQLKILRDGLPTIKLVTTQVNRERILGYVERESTVCTYKLHSP